MLDESGKSFQFWSRASWKNQALLSRDPGKLDADNLRPPIQRDDTVVSKLSSDDGASEMDDEDSDGEALSCKKCGGKDFRARKLAGRGQKLVCTKCGTTVE